jgi:hypothetical protein
MTLTRNQIEHLFIWVHPACDPVADAVLDEWRLLIDVLEYEPRCALLETTLNRELLYGLQLQQQHEERERKVSELELRAEEKLGERYHVWELGDFVVAEDPMHVNELRRLFHVEERVFPHHLDRRLLRSVSVYGLLPDMCVVYQTYNFKMHLISTKRESLGISPIRNLPPHVPSTREAFDVIADVRYRDLPAKIFDAVRDRLPSIEAVIRSCMEGQEKAHALPYAATTSYQPGDRAL